MAQQKTAVTTDKSYKAKMKEKVVKAKSKEMTKKFSQVVPKKK